MPRDLLHPALHLAILGVCTVVVVLSVLLTPSAEALTLMGVEIPPMCMWKNLTGSDCLGCGLTRSFTFMGHGRIKEAFELHLLGPLFFVIVAAQLPWRTLRLGHRLAMRMGWLGGNTKSRSS